MRVPKYVTDPKAGVRDSIRKWEWIKKNTIKEKTIGMCWFRHAGDYCGICAEAFNKVGGYDLSEACKSCKFPKVGGCIHTRCMSGRRNVSNALENRIDFEKCTEKDRKTIIRCIDEMLKTLRSIK